MRVNRILETCLYVDDLDEGERFYRDVLGLSPFARRPNRHVFFDCGRSVFLLFNPEQTREVDDEVPAHGARGAGHVAFAMAWEDIEEWRRQLARHGVRIEKEVAWPRGGHSLYFRDPAGNSVELATPEVWGRSGDLQ